MISIKVHRLKHENGRLVLLILLFLSLKIITNDKLNLSFQLIYCYLTKIPLILLFLCKNLLMTGCYLLIKKSSIISIISFYLHVPVVPCTWVVPPGTTGTY